MTLCAGFDFGTSNSSIAIADGDGVRLLPLDPLTAEPSVMRSLLYLTRGGEQFVGQEAFDRHQRDNIGRPVKLERRYVGDVQMTFAGIGTLAVQANALVDANEPGRLFQSIKTLLPDRVFSKTSVFGVDLTTEDLIELLAGNMLRRAETAAGSRITRLTVGRPVHFAGDPANDDLARTRLSTAFARFGVEHIDFLEEPVAAALSYTRSRAGRDAGDRPAVIFDFGGGTLDVSVVRSGGAEATVLATGGVPVGGDLLDRRIVESRMLAHFGDDATFGPERLPVPRHVIAQVLDWQTLYLLNRPEPLALIEQMVRTGSRPTEMKNLYTLVTRGYGAALFRAVEAGKQALSSDDATTITLDRGDLDIREPLQRGAFEGIIREQHRQVSVCVADTVARAGVAPDNVGAVVTTGGSSRIPLFRRTLAEMFPRARLVDQNAFTSVAAGLAIAAREAALAEA